MFIHHPLNKIFSATSHITVLRELRFTNNGFTGREIAKRAGLSAPAALSALTRLEALGIVRCQIGGRDHIFTLRVENYFVKKIILPILGTERDFYKSIAKEITDALSQYSESLILFGSVAREEENESSDYDICIVYSGNTNRRILESKVNTCRSKLTEVFGITLGPYYISRNEFAQRAKLNKSPIGEIIQEGIVLSGKRIGELIHDNKKFTKKN